jgi:hypothetical protein
MYHSPVKKNSTLQTAAGASVNKKKPVSAGLYLTDNRSRSVAQKKQYEGATSSIAAEGATVQLQTVILNTSQQYKYGLHSTITVGKEMNAWLDPDKQAQGQSANLNKIQNGLMGAIRKKYFMTGGEVVKGHLLNDNLGGSALSRNLYPITAAANHKHLMYAENLVKKRIWEEEKGTYYKVTVEGKPDIKTPNANFVTLVKEWDVKNNKVGKTLSNVRISSVFTKKINTAKPKSLDKKIPLKTFPNPLKGKKTKNPIRRAGKLSIADRKKRKNDK